MGWKFIFFIIKSFLVELSFTRIYSPLFVKNHPISSLALHLFPKYIKTPLSDTIKIMSEVLFYYLRSNKIWLIEKFSSSNFRQTTETNYQKVDGSRVSHFSLYTFPPYFSLHFGDFSLGCELGSWPQVIGGGTVSSVRKRENDDKWIFRLQKTSKKIAFSLSLKIISPVSLWKRKSLRWADLLLIYCQSGLV